MMDSTTINNLKNTKTYLVGAMDRVKDGGSGWRNEITPMLSSMGIKIIDPCKKNILGVKEDEETRWWIEYYKETKQFSKIRQNFGSIRNADLRCVDKSDFIIFHLDLDIHACGSYEEVVTANRQKKPVLVICKQGKSMAPNWLFFMLPHEHIFSNAEELVEYLGEINDCTDVSTLSRWFFLK